MKNRVCRLNELLRDELARLISREIPLDNGLITITAVQCAADLSQAKIFLTVLPQSQEAKALAVVRRNSRVFANALFKKLKIKQIPHFIWRLDELEKNALVIEKTISAIHREKN